MKFITEIIKQKEHLWEDFNFDLQTIVPAEHLSRKDHKRLRTLLKLAGFSDLNQLVKFTISHFSFLGSSSYEFQILQKELEFRIRKRIFLIDFLPISLYIIIRYSYCRPVLDKIIVHSNKTLTNLTKNQDLIHEYALYISQALEGMSKEKFSSLSSEEAELLEALKSWMNRSVIEKSLHHEFLNPRSPKHNFKWLREDRHLEFLSKELEAHEYIFNWKEFYDTFHFEGKRNQTFFIKKVRWNGTQPELCYLFLLMVKANCITSFSYKKLANLLCKEDGTEFSNVLLSNSMSRFKGSKLDHEYDMSYDPKNLNASFQPLHNIVKRISNKW